MQDDFGWKMLTCCLDDGWRNVLKYKSAIIWQHFRRNKCKLTTSGDKLFEIEIFACLV